MDRTEANSGTREVSERLRFDEAALTEWMAANVEGFCGPIDVSQFKGGQSNPTYRIDGASGSYVLRRKPPGKLLPGAHAVEREYRVLASLGAQGFPVPRVYALCEDEGVLGTPFYLMDMVPGRIIWDATFPGLDREERAAHFDAMNATIAQLHNYDPQAIGLGDYGKATGFVERQVARAVRRCGMMMTRKEHVDAGFARCVERELASPDCLLHLPGLTHRKSEQRMVRDEHPHGGGIGARECVADELDLFLVDAAFTEGQRPRGIDPEDSNASQLVHGAKRIVDVALVPRQRG